MFFSPASGLPGYKFVDKFGNNPVVGTDAYEEIWTYSEAYTYDASPITAAISSSEDPDTFEYTISGLDADWNPQEVNVTLTGETKKVVSGYTWMRINRCWNNSGDVAIGNVYIYDTTEGTVTAGVPQTDSKVKAMVAVGEEQTLMSIWTMPDGCQGYVRFVDSSILGSVTNDRAIDLSLDVRKFGKVFRTKRHWGVSSDGSTGHIQDMSMTHGIGLIDERSDVRVRGKAFGGDVECSSNFHIEYWRKAS